MAPRGGGDLGDMQGDLIPPLVKAQARRGAGKGEEVVWEASSRDSSDRRSFRNARPDEPPLLDRRSRGRSGAREQLQESSDAGLKSRKGGSRSPGDARSRESLEMSRARGTQRGRTERRHRPGSSANKNLFSEHSPAGMSPISSSSSARAPGQASGSLKAPRQPSPPPASGPSPSMSEFPPSASSGRPSAWPPLPLVSADQAFAGASKASSGAAFSDASSALRASRSSSPSARSSRRSLSPGRTRSAVADGPTLSFGSAGRGDSGMEFSPSWRSGGSSSSVSSSSRAGYSPRQRSPLASPSRISTRAAPASMVRSRELEDARRERERQGGGGLGDWESFWADAMQRTQAGARRLSQPVQRSVQEGALQKALDDSLAAALDAVERTKEQGQLVASKLRTAVFSRVDGERSACPRCRGSGLLNGGHGMSIPLLGWLAGAFSHAGPTWSDPCWFCQGIGVMPIFDLQGYLVARSPALVSKAKVRFGAAAAPLALGPSKTASPDASKTSGLAGLLSLQGLWGSTQGGPGGGGAAQSPYGLLSLYLGKFPEARCIFRTSKLPRSQRQAWVQGSSRLGLPAKVPSPLPEKALSMGSPHAPVHAAQGQEKRARRGQAELARNSGTPRLVSESSAGSCPCCGSSGYASSTPRAGAGEGPWRKALLRPHSPYMHRQYRTPRRPDGADAQAFPRTPQVRNAPGTSSAAGDEWGGKGRGHEPQQQQQQGPAWAAGGVTPRHPDAAWGRRRNWGSAGGKPGTPAGPARACCNCVQGGLTTGRSGSELGGRVVPNPYQVAVELDGYGAGTPTPRNLGMRSPRRMDRNRIREQAERMAAQRARRRLQQLQTAPLRPCAAGENPWSDHCYVERDPAGLTPRYSLL